MNDIKDFDDDKSQPSSPGQDDDIPIEFSDKEIWEFVAKLQGIHIEA